MRSRSSERAPPATRISPDMPDTVIFWKSTFCSSVLSERFRLRGTLRACTGSEEVPADDVSGVSSGAESGMTFIISFRSSRSDFT